MTTHNITPAETTTIKSKTKKAKSPRKTTWSSEPELDESGNLKVKGKTKKAKSPRKTTWSSEPELDESGNLEVKGNTKKAKSPRKTTWSSEPELDESGNLKVIDIDTITWSAIDTAFFNTVAEMYPTLCANLCIHRTQSGGDQIQSLEQERLITVSEMEAKEGSFSRTNKKGKVK